MLNRSEPPLHVGWEITRHCNLRCRHCSSDSGPEANNAGELSTADALRVIDELADTGVAVVGYSGGEPLTRADLPQLLGRTRDRGMSAHLCTNGALLDEPSARVLAEAGLRGVTVSLDGFRAGTHDLLRGGTGLFDLAVAAIRRLVGHGFRVSISFTPTTLNHGELDGVIELAHRLGVASVCVSQFIPTGRGTRELMLEPVEQQALARQVWAMQRAHGRSLRITSHDCHVALLVEDHEREHYRGCAAGLATAGIKPDGTVTPCVFMPNPLGNVRQQKFTDIWDNSSELAALRDRDALQTGNCGACRFKLVCGGCRAAAQAIHGNPLAGDPSCWMFPELAEAN